MLFSVTIKVDLFFLQIYEAPPPPPKPKLASFEDEEKARVRMILYSLFR